ncbi:hypothetical protein BKA67DRAFT_667381 [Truncatella angustata]|uniref:Uncharacterized protein n=1 Tax=Truncatella angustata TaxID=152316 RepID=A0A9P9A537_9PEZI|nr:uncharacterized protein BKA67DRAFT_667381 [Truncatella angustata]KAH6660499.1 hypothetical protein BKA67DRAFT_667381 [Truncatella angustata]
MAAITAEQLLSSKPRGDSTSDSAASRPVPLICSICPKNTNFSDVSHLLTHISSKGHLSNMFKLDIARYTDQGAREKLEEYQAWFDEFNIRELLQSRSENRIQKGSVGRSRNGSSTRGGTPTVGLRGGRTSLRVRDDSKLTTRTDSIKCTPEDDIDLISDFKPSSHAHAQQHWRQNNVAQSWSDLPSWNGAYYGSGFQQELGFGIDQPDADADENDDDEEEEEADTVSKYEPSDNEDEELGSTSIIPSDDTMNTTMHDADVQAALDILDIEERERLHFRKYLKGDIASLEGVGGFDAAPEEQRRKRNQKKDPSVLVHMEASSKAVRTLEQVTDLNFNHVRWRDVYDEPSVAGSENDDEPKPPKKRRRSPKKTRGRPGRPRAIKVERATSRDSSFAPATRGRGRGRAARITRQASIHSTAPRPSSTQGSSLPTMPTLRLDRSTRTNFSSISNFGAPGHVRVGNRVVDVFRDNMDTMPSATDFPAIQRQQDGLPDLTLRPGNTNLSLLSPTPMLKRHTPSRLFPSKENSRSSFQTPPTTSNPYLSNMDSLNESSFNPLCVQSQESAHVQGYSTWKEDTKLHAAGFQPINTQPGFNSLHLTSHNNDNYYSPH